MRKTPGIYVEILVASKLEDVWRVTQMPEQHQRWDLRFSQIEYVPKAEEAEPQRFLYETRIGFGLAIRGTGESVATRANAEMETTSSLKFASDDAKSLIREGAGYWKYVPTAAGLRFFTWYDYRVRFGALGRLADMVFRPVMGWATAWSFDRMRLWVEDGQTPEVSMAFAVIHAVVRMAIATIWIWHGLVPKLIFHHMDEQKMLAQAGLPVSLMAWIGTTEVIFGLMMLVTWTWRWMFVLNVMAMVAATCAVAVYSPEYLRAAFNPVTLNLAVAALAAVGWVAAARVPKAGRCLRMPATVTAKEHG